MKDRDIVPHDRMHFRFKRKNGATNTRIVVVEAPSFYIARAWARVELETDELDDDYLDKPTPRDCLMKWQGSDYGGVRRLFVKERRAGAFGEWEQAQL